MADKIVPKQKTALELIEFYRNDFMKVIPDHLKPERMLRIATGSIRRDQKLLACTAASVVRSVMEASILGLEIGVLGEGYLVPYNIQGTQTCTFQPGYQGLIKLAVQGGNVSAVQVGSVSEKDLQDPKRFDYGLGSHPFVRHKPSLDNNPNEKPA